MEFLPMGSLTYLLLLILVALLVIYVTRRRTVSELHYKRPIKPATKKYPSTAAPPKPSINAPFVIFNQLKTERTEMFPEGAVLEGNYYIISGLITVRRNGLDISCLGPGTITHGSFELLGMNIGLSRVVAREALLSPLPEGDSSISMIIFEKTLVLPFLRLFCFTKDLLALEGRTCHDFAAFASDILKASGPIGRTRLDPGEKRSHSDQLWWVERGELSINGHLFGPGSVFGILSLFFPSCRGVFTAEALSETDLRYIHRRDLPATLDLSLFLGSFSLSSLPPFLLDCSAAIQWRRLYPRSYLFRSGTVCKHIYLSGTEVLSASEALLGHRHTSDHTINKISDVICVPSAILNKAFVHDPLFNSTFLRNVLFEGRCSGGDRNKPVKEPRRAHLLLVTPTGRECLDFLKRLQRTLLTDSIVIKSRDLFSVSQGGTEGLSELLITEYLFRLNERYRIVIVYLENEWSRMLKLCAMICDLVYIVGRELVPNRLDRDNIEFIQLHDKRVAVKRPFLGKLLFRKNDESSSSESEQKISDLMDNNKTAVNNVTDNINSDVINNNNAADTVITNNNATDTVITNNNDADTVITDNNLINNNDADTVITNNNLINNNDADTVITNNNLINNNDADTVITNNFPAYRRIHHILCPDEDGHCMKDFERLSRCLLGERIGLVLGGGGARGLAHIGVIQALEEENIPIDCIGGTSMGAFVGALYARNINFKELHSNAKLFAKSCASFFYFILDVTYPYVSLFTGRSFDWLLRSIFDTSKIENLWLEYYCVTTNLLDYCESIHFSGSVWKWVRASMTICGYLPPFCINGKHYVDGAYVNNVPADIMKSMDVKTVIMVDVADEGDIGIEPYDSRSGFVLLFKRFFTSKRYLSLNDLQYRLSFLSTQQKNRLLPEDVLKIKPVLHGYRTSDFANFDEIVACGYASAKEAIKKWRDKGLISGIKRRTRSLSI